LSLPSRPVTRRNGLLAAGMTAALLAGCGSVDLGPQIAGVKKTETAYLTAVANGDGSGACSELTSSQVQAVIQSAASLGATSCPAAIGDFAHSLSAAAKHDLLTAQIVNVQINVNQGSAQIKGSSRTYGFAKQGGKWLISSGVSSAPAASSTAVPASGVAAAAYVHSVCSAVGPFEKNVQTSVGALNPKTVQSPASGKTALESFLNSVSKDAGTTLSQLRAAGTPKVPGGAGIETAIVAAFARLDGALRMASTSAAALPTTNATAFRSAATGLGTTVRDSISGISVSLASLKSPALQAAAAKDPACAALTG
jgi:hypothetical protein